MSYFVEIKTLTKLGFPYTVYKFRQLPFLTDKIKQNSSLIQKYSRITYIHIKCNFYGTYQQCIKTAILKLSLNDEFSSDVQDSYL